MFAAAGRTLELGYYEKIASCGALPPPFTKPDGLGNSRHSGADMLGSSQVVHGQFLLIPASRLGTDSSVPAFAARCQALFAETGGNPPAFNLRPTSRSVSTSPE